MALPKLFQRIFWHNNTTPAINEDNLNAISKGLSDVDDRVIDVAATVMETVPALEEDIADLQEVADKLEEMTANPPYIGANGNWYIWETQTEAYVDSGIDASITVTIADITMLSPNATPYVTNTGTPTDPIFHLFIPQGKAVSSIAKTGTSGLVDTYTITFNDGTTTTYTITNGKTAYQSAVDGGYSGTEAQFEADLANFGIWATNAAQSASDSEAYANGKRSGSDVPSTDPAYHNNSLWYSQQAATSETNAAQSASDALGAASQISSLLQVPQFTVDFTTGNLMYTMDAVYSFVINTTTGNLEWEVITT